MAGLVILDRDGVINRDSADFVKSADEWQPLPGSMEAIGILSAGGCTVCIATNQSGLGRGLFDEQALDEMHGKLRRLAAEHGGQVARIVYCPHRPEDECDCRKPRPGLIEGLGRELAVAVAGVPVVGDSLRDIDAAIAAGARPVLVLTGNGRTTARQLEKRGQTVETYPDLLAFARHHVAGPKQ